MSEKGLYERLGGYDGLTAFADNLLPRLIGDDVLGRFWANRGDDGLAREKQLLVDFLASSAGGPLYYTGCNMALTHTGMGITEDDWGIFLGHAGATFEALSVPEQEVNDVVAFVLGLKDEIVGV